MKVQTLLKGLTTCVLVLFLASIAAENLPAQMPRYFVCDYGFNGEFGIGVFNIDGSNVYNVLPNTQASPPPGFSGGCSLNRTMTPIYPSTSGDGSLIAFESLATADPLDTGHRVFLMNRDGTGVQQVTSRDAAEDRFPVISPDGTKIAFLSQRNTAQNTRQVFTVNIDGSNLQPITQEVCNPGCSQVTAVAWSPDSTQLAFGCFNCGLACPFPNEGIKIINADGTGESPLACGRNGAPGAINWSSDGTRIAFEDAFGLAGRDGMGISQVGPDGTRLGDITPDQLGRSPGGVGGLGATGPGAFRYSPDSTMLAYAIVATTGGPQGISLINLDGTGKQDVVTDHNYHNISWQSGPAILSPATLTLSPDPLVGRPQLSSTIVPGIERYSREHPFPLSSRILCR